MAFGSLPGGSHTRGEEKWGKDPSLTKADQTSDQQALAQHVSIVSDFP